MTERTTNEPTLIPNPIKTIGELITRLEAIRTDLDVRALTLHQYERVGWATRPLEGLLDRCREEAESSSWAERRVALFRSLWPRAVISPAVITRAPPSPIGPSSSGSSNGAVTGAQRPPSLNGAGP